MRMLLSTGFRCTRRYLDYHEAVMACLPSGAVHVLPLLGIHPQFQGRHYGEQLLAALHNWCAEDVHSEGVVLDTGNSRYLEFYKRQGYEEIGQIAVGPVLEHVFFHPSPQRVEAARA
ncbi:Acetyltransferase (GNAT) family protein [compost metagenome]